MLALSHVLSKNVKVKYITVVLYGFGTLSVSLLSDKAGTDDSVEQSRGEYLDLKENK
jgi:hypothetical protein